ncbi:LacI family DNA-binding transcriptional regulator [Vibrio aestuarianus]|uniref:LacI family DNA-binding transcriptional regulator n=1 Tax=Vibrio aestuarianus TaxID=28171 RepID=A0A9X4FB25_9VIBR|nr:MULTISPECIES: LacI family DNA-binding transcriptional regulator [Vibrio]MDE1236863.1 LacI family DNA-binding transcriptional regulator [Vibrio aestuarianus]MDE1247727.1 LacI family DNA-binding transcriptional regulator [Vibrio aestuarianus]MDE1311676.1 LacI family DNA-binding transcriptional regulator [Vibrio aestuarianus]MDE1348189.1 LacI family DNA-binding transcriptional regulator [Vibrio aestuarianus]MDE1358860.1 LacI family DNA-binding transcriptional regulator [Vibrio aestuarianus]
MDKTNKTKAPTAYEVAKLANVSPSTVSRYFNMSCYSVIERFHLRNSLPRKMAHSS